MPFDVSSEVIIGRPRAIVSGYAANPYNAPKWCVNIKSVNWKTPRPLGPGSQLAFAALCRRLASTYAVVTDGILMLVAPFMAWAMRRANRKDLAN